MPRTILVADDDAVLRQEIAWCLRAGGYRVVEAADGIEALRLLGMGARAADLAVLDVRMPRANGLDVVSRMQRDPRLHRIPVVVLTAFPVETPGDLVMLPKPFSPARLLETIGAVLGGSPAS